MKQKLFTLLTLLLGIACGAWAAGPSDPTIASLTAKTFTSTELLWTTPTNATTWYNAGWVVGGKSGSRGTFTSVTNKKYTINPTNDETVTATACEGLGIKKDSDTKTVYFCVTNVTAVDIYVMSNGSSERTARMVISNSTNSDKITKTGAAAANSSAKISATGLNAAYTYLIKVDETGGSDMTLYAARFTAPDAKNATSEVLKSSAAVKVDDIALTKDAATNSYNIDETTITLSDDIEALSTPSNVKLVKTTSYDDESTEDADVAVTFDGTVTSGYFIGTASIGLTGSVTDYTVRVKKNLTPTATLSETSGSIALTESWKTGFKTVTLAGANLTDGTYNVTADVAGVTISPSTFTITDGAVEQEFTLTSTATTAASTVITFGTSSIGVAAPTYTLSYSQSATKRSASQTDVTGSTTWDWTKSGGASIELTASTIPANGEEFIMAELPEITNDANFNSQALKIACQWPNRGTSYYFQGNTIKFTTTVPGTVQVWFSNTSNRSDTKANRRFLYINGTNSDVYTLDQTFTNTEATAVDAGEVIINAFTGEDTPAATMVRINKIVFTETVPVSTLADRNYASYVPTKKLDFASADGITAYIATGLNAGETAVVLQEVDVVDAGTPIIVKTDTKGATVNVPVTTAAPTDASENKLVAGDGTTSYDAGTYYYLANDQFHLATSGTLQSGKAYLQISGSLAPQLAISFGNEGGTTGIGDAVKSDELRDMNYYNLAGQRVAQPTKGLYIVNGKKVVMK